MSTYPAPVRASKLAAALLTLLLAACGATPDQTPSDAGAGHASSAPSCGPDNCEGCCSDSGECLDGSFADSCGQGGVSCAVCLPEQACANRSCTTTTILPEECSSANCAGCCDAEGVCHPGTSTDYCGAGGLACRLCESNAFCEEGACRVPPCTPESCPNGCCDPQRGCQSGSSNGACGWGGAACVGCPDDAACADGACIVQTFSQQLPGSPCTEDGECSDALGTRGGGACLLAKGPDGKTGWDQGYCTTGCSETLPCPVSAACVEGTCLALCSAPGSGQGSCRNGYVCHPQTLEHATSRFGYCVPTCIDSGFTCPSKERCNALGYCG